MPTDDALFGEMIKAVRDLGDRLTAYERKAEAERRELRRGVDNALAALRKDVHEVTSKLQLDASQHRDEHTAQRVEQAKDATERIARQLTMNLWMGALTVLVVINLLLLGLIVVRAWIG